MGDTELYYYRTRYYDASFGMVISTDTISQKEKVTAILHSPWIDTATLYLDFRKLLLSDLRT